MPESRKIYEFAGFRLDPAEQVLRRGSLPVLLKPKIFETLVILVESGGNLVAKDDFVKRLWPDSFASDESLAQNISQLRKVLGNGADGTPLIQTVPKRGYRFMAPVQVIEPGTSSPSAFSLPIASPVEVPKKALPTVAGWKRVFFVVAGLVLFALVTLSVQLWYPPPDPRPPQLTPITSSGLVDAGGGIHSDGSLLIFLERNGSQWPLMQTSIGGGPETPFAAPFPNTRIHAMSPNQTEWLISSFTDLISNMPLWIVPVQGGIPFRVGDITVDSATWFPDGRRIIAARGNEVFAVDRDGRNQRTLFKVQGRAADFHWRPDGSQFRFTLVSERSEPSLWEASPDESSPHRVDLGLPPGTPACCGIWTSDGKYYVFTAAEKDRGDIWVLRENPTGLFFRRSHPVQLTAGPIAYFGPPVSVGKRLFVFGSHFRANPVRYDQRTGSFEPFLTKESFIDLTFSRDGKWVAYIGENGILWRSKTDGSERLRLTDSPMRALRPRWSRDGKKILFVAERPGLSYTPFVVAAEGGPPIQIFKQDKLSRSFADWSPDEQSVVMDVLPGVAPEEGVTVVNLANGQASQFPGSQGMRNVRWSPDGRYLAASSDDAKTLYLFNAASQRWIPAASARSVARMEWSYDGRFLYFQDIFDSTQAVFRLNPETLSTERVLDFSKPLQAGAVRCGFEGLAPDGSLLASIRHSALDIYALDVDLR